MKKLKTIIIIYLRRRWIGFRTISPKTQASAASQGESIIEFRGSQIIIYFNLNHFRVYYYPQKNLKLCKNCWQDFLIDTDLYKIDTPDSALQNMKKIDTWLSTMKKHGACYYITKIYDNFYVELGKYEQKLDEIRGKLNKAQQDDEFMEYPKIEHESLELLKQLWSSNVMHNYKSHFSQVRINIIANEVR